MTNCFKRFLNDDSGAVTVDWVVMTAATVGLGLAVIGTVSTGTGSLSNDIARALSGMYVNVTELASHDFSNGQASGWIGGRVMDMGGQMGELLVLGPGEVAGFTLDVPPGSTEAAMVFDLVAGDSLDNSARWGTDTATIMVNGVPVVIATSAAGSHLVFDIPQVDGTHVEATVTVDPTEYGGSGRWNDSVAGVTITVDQPTGPIDIQMVSGANQGINDEFWGIDNFEGSATQ